uniref:Uncharacterized protein n=1 Tax=Arundo donax TaxID=35708 RepID=A0A0A9BGM2_ARUDO
MLDSLLSLTQYTLPSSQRVLS